jgi:hypoxanthine phosphoribosyltransferase
LSRALPLPHERDLLELEPYSAGQAASLRRRPQRSPRRRDVILVDQVVDTGLSLGFLCREIEQERPRSLAACVFFDRPHRRLLDDLPLRYVGYVVPDALFGGYGLTHDPALSELPDVYAVGARSAEV